MASPPPKPTSSPVNTGASPPAPSAGSSSPAPSTGEDAQVQQALRQLSALLIPNETIDAYAVQRRIFALDHRRTVVAATSGRFLGMQRKLFGGFEPQTVRWQDLKDIRLQVGTFGADLTLVALTAPDLAVTPQTHTVVYTGLRKTQAEAVYRLCQANEQAWREKRRIRELEEMRAKAGGIQLGAAPSISAAGSTSEDADPVKKLERAREMLSKGLISDSEYESLKARIVSSM